MKKTLALILSLCMVFSMTAFASDYQVTTNKQVNMTVTYQAEQYDSFIVTIPASINIEGGFNSEFTVKLDVDENYNQQYSNIDVSLDYNDTYGEWTYEEDDETFWDRGFHMDNHNDGGFHFCVIRMEDERQLFPGNLDGTEYSGRRFDQDDLNVQEDRQMGYDCCVIHWEMGAEQPEEMYAETNLQIKCFVDLRTAVGTYEGMLTFGIGSGYMDDWTLLNSFDKIWNKNDSENPADWTVEDNNGRYSWDEANGCLVALS